MFEVATSNGLGGYAFTRKYVMWPFTIEVKVKQNVAQYTLHQMTYAPAKFEVATSNSLGIDAYKRKYII